MHASELRELRLRVGLTQNEFAQELGISRVFVGLMERGIKPISNRTAAAARSVRDKPLNRAPQETDPQRRLLEKAFIKAGTPFQVDHLIDGVYADFFLPIQKIMIFLARSAEESRDAGRVVSSDVIVLRGKQAVVLFALLVEGGGCAMIDSPDERLYSF